MKIVLLASLLVFTGTSAFAGPSPNTSTSQNNDTPNVETHQVAVVKASVPLRADVEASTPAKRRVSQISIEPVEALAAREASTSDHNHFLYQLGKHANTKTKTYRPSAPKSEGMPNLFKK